MFIIIMSFIAVGSLLVWYLLRHDHGRKLPVASLWAAFGFGILAMVLAGILEFILIPKNLLLFPQAYTLGHKFLIFLGVGVIEEYVKFVPLALFIYRKSYFKDHTDGVIFFAICGLTFGMFENIFYTLDLGAGAGIARLLITPFFHAAATSIIGYYLASMKINLFNKPKFLLAFFIVPFLHGFYDFGLSSGNILFLVMSLMITLLFTMGLFLYFMKANELDKSAIELAAAARPHYCSACGKANTGRTMFCEYCGHQL